MATTVKIGTRFRSVYADSNALFEITRKAGPSAWEAVITRESGDYEGVAKLFSTEEVRRSLKAESFWKNTRAKSNDFYTTAKLGSVVHYHHGFGGYIRCEVVMGVTVHSDGKTVKCLKPVALVGNWKPYDLPRRNRDGSIHLGYHAGSIAKGEVFSPHASNIWECPEFNRAGNPNPTSMPAVDLSVPAMTSDEEAAAKLEALRLKAIETLTEGWNNPAEALANAKALLANVG